MLKKPVHGASGEVELMRKSRQDEDEVVIESLEGKQDPEIVNIKSNESLADAEQDKNQT